MFSKSERNEGTWRQSSALLGENSYLDLHKKNSIGNLFFDHFYQKN